MIQDTERILEDPMDIENGSEYELEDDHNEYISTYYDIKNIIFSMGTNKFRNVFYIGMETIKNSDFAIQKHMVMNCMDKILELYGFEFQEEISIVDSNDLNKFYDYLYFIEYGIVKAMSTVIKNTFDFNPMEFLSKNDKKSFFETKINIDKMIEAMISFLKKENYLILSFFLYNNKEYLEQYFIEKILMYSDEFIFNFLE